ncbi:Na+/H+ antiporter subunit E [Devosia sp. 2618]|uniref:Na+/H+ antiporter subunit E n=1 Tax=Devosia sp. 2618 TaxID=3156454 RepID=UPI0033909CF3
MSRILPYPLLALSLLIMWLLLQQSFSVGNILLGSVLAVLASRAMAALRPDPVKIRKPLKMVQLFAIVVADVVRSNIAVAQIILQGRKREQTSGFLTLPLELRDKSALAILACILTATPGSAWLEYDTRRNTVLIHVLDLVDEQAWIDTIKNRYEKLLLEIFQ